MTVDVIIPWRAGSDDRQRALVWVTDRHIRDGWHVTVAEAPEGPWVKANAVMPAIEASTADIVAVCDADVSCGGLREAVAAVEACAPWAIPHRFVHRLTAEATSRVLDGAEPDETMPLTQPRYPGVMAGGMVVLPREHALDVPLDARFVGWGGEDHSWGYALLTLLGDPWRGTAPLFHLWHPSQPRLNRRVGSYQSERLRRRYRLAEHNRTPMLTLIEEARAAWQCRSSSTAPASGTCSGRTVSSPT